MGKENTSHPMVSVDDYKLFKASDSDVLEGTISLASRVQDAYPDTPPAERVEIFHDLGRYLNLPTDRGSLTQIRKLLKARHGA